MIDSFKQGFQLPPEQRAIRDKCFHPSGTFVEFPIEEIETSIPERFEKIVRMHPGRFAVEMDDERVTYEALNRAANRLANTILADRDVDNTPIVVILPGGFAQAVAILAVLKAGKMFLLQDPSSTDEERNHVLSDTQARLMITSENIKSAFSGLEQRNLRVIDVDVSNDRNSDQNPRIRVSPDMGAYIKYTSGSTKRAKGVIIPHRTILHGVMSYTNSCHFCSHDRSVQVNGNSIRRSFFVHLLNGATLCPFDFRSGGIHQLAPWMERHEITIYRSFPGAFRLFVSLLSERERFPKLRIIRLGGEPMYRSDVELFKKHFQSDCVLIHSYASSETGFICSYYLDQSTKIIGHRVPVGYPEKGKELSIVDEQGGELSVDQPGEIVVRSRFISSGYWQHDDESKVNFQASIAQPETKIYHTGDIGQLSADGLLTHLGRKDDRVKIRNFRVDVGEVEATLAEHPEVKLASVIAKEEFSGDTRLIAYFVPRNKPGPSFGGLREYLGVRLPPYMVPSVCVALDDLPLTGTGKVNRRALPDPGKSRPNLATPLVAPTTEVEGKLAAIWENVLSLDRVGVNDNFFDLGGHSLAATRVVSQVIKQFQLELPLLSLFQSPTVAEMAAVIIEHRGKLLGEEELERLLGELEMMSDEEAQQLVAKDRIKT